MKSIVSRFSVLILRSSAKPGVSKDGRLQGRRPGLAFETHRWREVRNRKVAAKFGPHPEEPGAAGRLEGWPLARSSPGPSFETHRLSDAPQDEDKLGVESKNRLSFAAGGPRRWKIQSRLKARDELIGKRLRTSALILRACESFGNEQLPGQLCCDSVALTRSRVRDD